MKKILLLSIILLSVMMTACKPDPINNEGDDNNDTIQEEEPIVKKYLVREYADYMGRLRYIIDWNDDFTRIEHITADSGTWDQIDYDFYYYGVDSMKVVAYTPSSGLNNSSYVCYLTNNRIFKIDFYSNNEYKYTNYRTYNEEGKLISNIDSVNNCGTIFEWEGNNVVKTYSYSDGEETGTIYGNFSEHIHPYYTLPHLLRGYGYNIYISQPLWKNFAIRSESHKYEYDSDGYVISEYYINEYGNCYGNVRYEYAF